MKQYYQAEDKTVNAPTTVEIDKVNRYFDKLTQAERNKEGYFDIKYGSQPNTRYYVAVEDKGVVDNVYTINYTAQEKPLTDVQGLMIKSLFEAGEGYNNSATVDTGLGFLVKATRNDLDSFERGAKRNMTELRDVTGTKRVVSVPEMSKIADNIEDNGVVLFDIKWNKFDEIQAFTTVDECILYEATPYDEDGVTHYRNQCTDWEI